MYEPKKVVYIAGPFRGKSTWEVEQNVRRAEEVALKVWKLGAAVICPHANTRFFQNEAADEIWLKGDLEILKRCDALLLISGWKESVGARLERDHALKWGIEVMDSLEELEEWLYLRSLPNMEERYRNESRDVREDSNGGESPAGEDSGGEG